MLSILHGDCRSILRTLPPDSIDSVITDPPYGIQFMSKHWDDAIAFQPRTWAKVLRVLKPGGYMLCFGGTRTFHRIMVAIEDAGFEIRDTLMWVYGSGFPKSHDVRKGIDNHFEATREVVGRETSQWQGWGTALKPSYEPIILARKPLIGTVAENVLKYGTGGINIDACRVPSETTTGWSGSDRRGNSGVTAGASNGGTQGGFNYGGGSARPVEGRWPANLLHDGSDEVMDRFAVFGEGRSRFFYCAKASKTDRAGSRHPTVKPQALMRWLVKLVTPADGITLDCFAGSGSTLRAALAEGFDVIGIEREEEYVTDMERRLGAKREDWKLCERA